MRAKTIVRAQRLPDVSVRPLSFTVRPHPSVPPTTTSRFLTGVGAAALLMAGIGLTVDSYPHWANPQVPENLRGKVIGPFSVVHLEHATREEIARRRQDAREQIEREHQIQIDQALRSERLRGELGLFVGLLAAVLSGVMWWWFYKTLGIRDAV